MIGVEPGGIVVTGIRGRRAARRCRSEASRLGRSGRDGGRDRDSYAAGQAIAWERRRGASTSGSDDGMTVLVVEAEPLDVRSRASSRRACGGTRTSALTREQFGRPDCRASNAALAAPLGAPGACPPRPAANAPQAATTSSRRRGREDELHAHRTRGRSLLPVGSPCRSQGRRRRAGNDGRGHRAGQRPRPATRRSAAR